jgi:hypothetical protein
MPAMTTTDYIIDSALVLLVLLQIREHTLTTRTLVRPLVILAIAVVNYLHGFPTTGNDLVLVLVFALVGGLIGTASGVTVLMWRNATGDVRFRAGWASASLWVLGMGFRFAFVVWITHSGTSTIARFSVHHAISGSDAWTVALLGMAVFEVVTRTLVMAARRQQVQETGALELA